jgi:hypothetical protein
LKTVVGRRSLVVGKTLELDASSISFQENVELPGRPSVEFVEGAVAFFQSVVSFVVTLRHGSIDGAHVQHAEVEGIDGLLGYFRLCPEPNLYERVKNNRDKLPG